MGKTGFVRVDGDYPNLALMQISAFHESVGDSVEWWKGPLYNHEYDSLYASKIFSFSKWPDGMPSRTKTGGTGIDFNNTLPESIAGFTPSYTLYPECNYHLGFSMKGCRFNCKFCCVPQKEGKPRINNDIDSILINPKGGSRLMLLDNDFFGGQNWKANLLRIIELKLKVCFIQGLNIRIITDEQAQLLAQCNYTNSKFNQKYLTFAWDRTYDRKLVMKGVSICNAAGIPNKRMQFFVLIGFDSTPDQDYERVMTLREMGCMPFVMPYNKSDKYQKAFTRWVNHRATFKSCTWQEYKYNPKLLKEDKTNG
jgi:hypothetical protein